MKISLEPTSHATPFTHREVENYLPIDTYIFPFKALDKGSSREKVVFEISEMGSCSNIRTFQKGVLCPELNPASIFITVKVRTQRTACDINQRVSHIILQQQLLVTVLGAFFISWFIRLCIFCDLAHKLTIFSVPV